MEATLPRSWKEQFALAASIREEDIKHREKLVRFDARQRMMREDERVRTEKRDREAFDNFQAVYASKRQIAEFRVKLDRYDEKTVEALMDNMAELDLAQKRVEDLRDNAHVLPDGRHAFKTRDGLRVFDEHGAAIGGDIVDPDLIGDTMTRWEDFKAADDAKSRLLRERQELLDYQARIDAARETVDKDGVTIKELDDLGADLDAAMPEAVRRKLGNEGPTRNAEAAPSEPSNGARAITINPVDQRPGGFSPM